MLAFGHAALAIGTAAVALSFLHRFVYAHHCVVVFVDLAVAQRAVLQVQQSKFGIQSLMLTRFTGVVDLG